MVAILVHGVVHPGQNADKTRTRQDDNSECNTETRRSRRHGRQAAPREKNSNEAKTLDKLVAGVASGSTKSEKQNKPTQKN